MIDELYSKFTDNFWNRGVLVKLFSEDCWKKWSLDL